MKWVIYGLGALVVGIGLAGSSRSATSTGEYLYQMSLLLMLFWIAMQGVE